MITNMEVYYTIQYLKPFDLFKVYFFPELHVPASALSQSLIPPCKCIRYGGNDHSYNTHSTGHYN